MSAKERKLEDYDRLLVVEGYSDLVFFAEFLEVLGKDNLVFIKPLGGNRNLKKEVEVLITPTLLERKQAIAFILDADQDPAATKQSLEKLLSDATGQAVVEGQWTDGPPKIGLLMVPGPAEKGEIETLVWQAWSSHPDHAGQKSCIEEFIQCMARQNATARSPDKALIGALLAVKNDDDPRLGPGTQANVFDLQIPHFKRLRQFLLGF
jgi:hypothetical protein